MSIILSTLQRSVIPDLFDIILSYATDPSVYATLFLRNPQKYTFTKCESIITSGLIFEYMPKLEEYKIKFTNIFSTDVMGTENKQLIEIVNNEYKLHSDMTNKIFQILEIFQIMKLAESTLEESIEGTFGCGFKFKVKLLNIAESLKNKKSFINFKVGDEATIYVGKGQKIFIDYKDFTEVWESNKFSDFVSTVLINIQGICEYMYSMEF